MNIKALRHRLHTAYLYLFGGLYVVLLIFRCVRVAGMASSLGEMFKLAFSSYPWGVFFLAYLILMVAISLFIPKVWKEELYADKLGKLRTFSMDNMTYGSAHWAAEEEYRDVAQIRRAEDAKGLILGQLTDDGSQCIDLYPKRLNSHIMVVGSSGTGKSFSFVLPYILCSVKKRQSLIVTDPKGELYQTTSSYLKQHGYVVRRLDLITLEKSDGWDCMKHLRMIKDPNELETATDIFCKTIINNIESGDENSIYARASYALLKTIVLYTILSDDVPEDKRTIEHVNKMLQQGGRPYFDGIFGRGVPSKISPAQKAYNSFCNSSSNLGDNVFTHLATGLEVLQTTSVEKILSTDETDLTLPGDRPCAYFCRFSATNDTYRFVSALFFSCLFTALISHADARESRRLAVTTNFLLDEFVSIGSIPSYQEKISTIRSNGINAAMIVQSFSQLESRYGDDATTILGNCGTIINVGMNDELTAKWLENRIGYTSVKVVTERTDARTGSVGGSQSHGVGRERLMAVSDIYEMPEDDLLILFQHKAPIYCKKFPITAHPEYRKLKPIKDDDIPDFSEREAREQMLLDEKKFIEEYDRINSVPVRKAPDEWEAPIDLYPMKPAQILSIALAEDFKALKIGKKKEPEKKVPATTPRRIYMESISPEAPSAAEPEEAPEHIVELPEEIPEDIFEEDEEPELIVTVPEPEAATEPEPETEPDGPTEPQVELETAIVTEAPAQMPEEETEKQDPEAPAEEPVAPEPVKQESDPVPQTEDEPAEPKVGLTGKRGKGKADLYQLPPKKKRE